MKHSLVICTAMLLIACQQQQLIHSPASMSKSRGHAFAQATCASCHAVEIDSTASPNPRAPPFPAIVNQEGLTTETLSTWLNDAHNYPGEMEFELEPSRVDDLVSYMLTLRDPAYKPQG